MPKIGTPPPVFVNRAIKAQLKLKNEISHYLVRHIKSTLSVQ